MKNCSACNAIIGAKVKACPLCGHSGKASAVVTQRNIIGFAILVLLLVFGLAVWITNYVFNHDNAAVNIQKEEMTQQAAIAAKAAAGTARASSKVQRFGWCDKAATYVEKMICSDDEITRLDFQMYAIYTKATMPVAAP
jgi:hypothetical protein